MKKLSLLLSFVMTLSVCTMQATTTIYEDEATFVQRIKGTSTEPIKCTVGYQCCDPQICFPPETKTIEIK